MPITTRSKFWGPLFPDVRGVLSKPFWGALWPDPGDPLNLVPPTGPAGVATFVADLDEVMTVVVEHQTDIFKSHDGQEKRAAVLDHPHRRITGSALLVGGASVLTLRAQLGRYAASGATFLLGLPYESILISANAVGTQITVAASDLASCDWANPGQRVVLMAGDRTTIDAVVQSASGSSINLDIAPGVMGKAGGYIMPTVPIYLEPQQGFARYRNPEGLEQWSIDARAALFGFQKSARAALLDIEATYPAAGNLVGVIIQARTPGIAGDSIRVSFAGDSMSGVDFTEVGTDIAVHFIPGVSTVAQVTALLNSNAAFVKCVGTWNETFVLGSGDVFALTQLDGGSDGDYATDGTGATVATHAARPVFDRGIVNDDTIDDSIHSMNELVELGGMLANKGQASRSDWGRFIAIESPWGPEWQWLKRFHATVRGCQRAFWLPTWRRDLTAVSSGAGTMIIQGPADVNGGFFSWYPAYRDIQIRQTDGAITRATITNAVDNGNGTITLTTGVTLAGPAIDMVSWLELCRLENDAITVRFQGHLFSIETTARAVTR